MKKIIFIAGFLLFVSVNAVREARLIVTANVEAILNLERRGGGDIDLFRANKTATFVGMSNSSSSVTVTVCSTNGLKVKDGEKEMPYTIKYNGNNVENGGTFIAPSGEAFSIEFESTKAKEACQAGNYTDTVTVTIAAGEKQAGHETENDIPGAGESFDLSPNLIALH